MYILVSLFLRLISVTCQNIVFQFQFQLLTPKQTLLCFCVSFYIVVMLNSDLAMIDPRKEFTWCRSKLYNMKDRLCSKVPLTKCNFLKIYSLQGLYLVDFFLLLLNSEFFFGMLNYHCLPSEGHLDTLVI